MVTPKKKRAPIRRPLTVKLTEKERKSFKRLANKHHEGNVSQLIRKAVSIYGQEAK